MSPERWREVRKVFEHIVERPEPEWPVLVDDLCGRSAVLREEVESLLAHHQAESMPWLLPESDEPDASDPSSISLDRFDVGRLIGQGGYGDVFLAYDRQRDAHVALKSLWHLDPKAIRGFKKGFRLLQQVRHRNLVRVHNLVYDGRSFYLSMELLEGTDFVTFSKERPAEVMAALGQLSSGVHALHEHGILHRDIKPSNVWVTPSGRVVVLDFGMAREIDVSFESGSGPLVGTPHYIAPELLDGAEPTRASDWYAVGVILHEVLTGAPPFEGSAFEVLVQKRGQPAPAPTGVDFPAELIELCAALLERDPSRRPDGASVVSRLGGDDVARIESHTTELIGRSRHVERLAESFERSRAEAVMVRIRGESGAGKTTLVQHFLKQLREERGDLVVLGGRCYVGESLPYKAVDEIVDELARYLSSFSVAEVEAILPRNAGLLARLFPVLSQLTARHRIPASVSRITDSVELRRRSFLALRELLGRLAERRRVVLFIDDAHWGDLDSVPLLTELLAPPEAPPLLWLFAYRGEDAGSSPFLSELLSRPSIGSGLASEELQVGALADDDAEELAAALLRRAGHAPAQDVARTIAAESGGNPLFVHQLVQHWMGRSGADVGETAVTLDRVIASRVETLPIGPRKLLEIVAVSGRRLEESVACRSVGNPATWSEERDRLVAERFLRPSPAGRDSDALEVFHDRVRESILAGLSEPRVRAHHAALAVSLEAELGVDPERLMNHFELGGDREKASLYAERAAESAAAALAFDRASELYRTTLEWGAHGPEREVALRRSLADALSNAGRGFDAAQQYLRTARGSAPEDRFELQRLAADHYLKSGHVEEGIELLRDLCHECGIWFPGGTWHVLLSTAWNRARVRLRGLPARGTRGAPLSKKAADQLNLCWTAGFGIGLIDAFLGSDFHSRFFLLATRVGDPRRVALALAAEVAYCAIAGERGRPRGESVYRRFESLAAELDDPLVRAFGLAMRGTMAWLLGDFRQARDFCDRALTIFRRESVGVGWERTTAQIIALSGMSMLGEWKRMAKQLPPLLDEAEARGDLYAHVGLRLMPYPYFIRLADDEPERARGEIREALSEWTPEGFHIQHCDGMFGLVDVALYEGRGWEALEIMESRRGRLRRSHLLYAQLTRVFYHTLRARAALSALGGDGGGNGRREEIQRSLRRDVRRVARERTSWSRGWSLLLVAGSHSLEGRLDEALAALESAEHELERVDLLSYKAAAQRRRGALMQGDEGNALRAEADAWLRARGIEAPERFADMFVPGRWR